MPSVSVSQIQFFKALPSGGEAAVRMAATDFSATALGSFESWSACLKSQLATLLSNSSPMRLTWGDAGDFRNDAYNRLMGEASPAELNAAIQAAFHSGLSTSLPVLEVQPFPAADRTALSASCAPAFDEDGRIAGTLTLCTKLISSDQERLRKSEDRFRQLAASLEKIISERTEELSRSRKFLNSLIEYNPNMVFVKDARDLRFVEMNRAGEDLLGIARADLLGKNDYDFFPKEQAERFTEKDRAVLRGHVVVDIPEEAIETRTRGVRILHTKKIPIFDARGEPQFLLGVSEDITEKIQAEKERLKLLRKQVALEQRELAARRTSFLAEASSVLTGTLDYQETLDNLARLAVELMGDWCSVNMLDEEGHCKRLSAFHRDSSLEPLIQELWNEVPVAEVVESVIRTGRSVLQAVHTPESLRMHALNARHLEILQTLGTASSMVVPLGVSPDRTHGAIVLVAGENHQPFDEEDLMVAEELGRRAGIAVENALLYGAAQRAIRSRDEFLSIASHELKTPLTSLKLQLQLTRRGLDPMKGRFPAPERLAKVLDDSNTQVNRLTTLIEDLLDVSRIGAGRLQFNFEPVKLAAVIQETIERYRGHFESEDSEVRLNLDPDVVAYCDRFRIEQVLINLLSNAAKYASGRPIEVTLLESEGRAVIQVRDFGMGIAKEMQKKIFERFERAVSSKNISGLGLGLYISREIVRAHHGEIEVESEPGQGSLFTVTLPCSPVKAPSPPLRAVENLPRSS